MALGPRPSRIQTVARGLAVDGAMLGGAGLATYGAWLTFRPAAFMVAGALLLVFGVAGARR